MQQIAMRGMNFYDTKPRVTGATSCLCMRKTKALRLLANDALVYKMKLGIRTGSRDGAGVVHLVSRFEERRLGPRLFDDAGSIPAKNLVLVTIRRGTCSHRHVDRVDRHCFDFNQKITSCRTWDGNFYIEERLRIIDR